MRGSLRAVLTAVPCAVICLAVSAASASASPTVRFGVRFTPYRLGGQTTIVYDLRVVMPHGELPPPVTAIDLHLPLGVGLATSTLGLIDCEASVLVAVGPRACPASARVGYGRARVAIPTERGIIREQAGVQAFSGTPQNENFVVLFYVQGDAPILTQLVFAGELLSDSHPYSGRLDTATPLIPTWPGGPYAVLTSFSSTIGPLRLTYYERRRGKFVPYRPRGIAIPARCPRGGFRFAAGVTFADGARMTAHSVVRCPRKR